MEAQEFNEKWYVHLERGFYGMAINDEHVINYLDDEFEKEIAVNPDFEYSQIKTKFGFARVYSTSTKNSEWEERINEILKSNK